MAPPRRRRIVGFLLVLALFAPWAAAAPEPSFGASAAERASGLADLWDWLIALWAENGCHLDPSGCPSGATEDPSAGSEVDNGCRIDPNGTPCTEGQ